jgi:hypothetical protein
MASGLSNDRDWFFGMALIACCFPYKRLLFIFTQGGVGSLGPWVLSSELCLLAAKEIILIL